ncbi:MAG: exodeoxyribonuclease VII small subunit [Clostridia bacterium]|nr:exodeoxyribonuclease VII small subunit [Clostridia bacterium]
MATKETFESAMAKLEEAVSALEGGNMSLDESLAAFENAVRLAKICNEKLECAERKVRVLTEGKDGSVTDAPFDTDEDAT